LDYTSIAIAATVYFASSQFGPMWTSATSGTVSFAALSIADLISSPMADL
jgi:hypothetical protein